MHRLDELGQGNIDSAVGFLDVANNVRIPIQTEEDRTAKALDGVFACSGQDPSTTV
jgi:hypothetical protein